MNKCSTRLGVGFATGRKNFRKVLNAYISNWKETNSFYNLQSTDLHLFVAYDTRYADTQSTDYTNLSQNIVDTFQQITFIGAKNAHRNIQTYVDWGIISEEEKKLLFGGGYAGKRNIILLSAIENEIDYLLFLDDDEYPVAVTNNKRQCLWSGQRIFAEHLESIALADITNGEHCGYISPIPQVPFDEVLTEDRFRRFVQAISNDIVNWETIHSLMENGGVTYADSSVLSANVSLQVEEVGHCKFISGSNLCINLKNPKRTVPFYNPPGARGEDTFLSTLLSERNVVRIPCYTFHDGFSSYSHLLDGVLPIHLKPISADSVVVKKRFYKACIGWVRYKPLLVYLTDRAGFEERVRQTVETFHDVLPFVCKYFEDDRFMEIQTEFEKYAKNAKKHAQKFEKAQCAWDRLIDAIVNSREENRHMMDNVESIEP